MLDYKTMHVNMTQYGLSIHLQHFQTSLTCAGHLQGPVTSLSSWRLTHSDLKSGINRIILKCDLLQFVLTLEPTVGPESNEKCFSKERKQRFSLESRLSPGFLQKKVCLNMIDNTSYYIRRKMLTLNLFDIIILFLNLIGAPEVTLYVHRLSLCDF